MNASARGQVTNLPTGQRSGAAARKQPRAIRRKRGAAATGPTPSATAGVWRGRGSPALGADGTVYVGSEDHKVYALSSASVGGLAKSPWPKFRADAQNTGSLDWPPQVETPTKFTALKERSEGRIAVEVVGKPLPTVQWFHNGRPVPDGTNAVLTLPEVNRALEGTYQHVATNVAGLAASDAIVAVVSNVDPQGYPAWHWESAGEGLFVEGSPLVTGPWAESGPLPPSVLSGFYVGTNALAGPRFYRLRGAAASRFTASFVASAQMTPLRTILPVRRACGVRSTNPLSMPWRVRPGRRSGNRETWLGRRRRAP